MEKHNREKTGALLFNAELMIKIMGFLLEGEKKIFSSMNIGRPKNSITLSNSQINVPFRSFILRDFVQFNIGNLLQQLIGCISSFD